MLLIADALYKWAALLVDKVDAGEKESLGSSGTKARSVDGGVVKGFGSTGQVPSEGGPPAHWIELVRRCAPEFISYEGSPLENPMSSLDPEHGEAKTQGRPADDPPTGIHVDPPQENPRRLANQPLNLLETKKFSMGGEVDKGSGSAKRGAPDGGAPAHWVELVRRQAPELLFHEDSVLEHPTDSFEAEGGKAKPEPEFTNDPAAILDADSPQVSPGRLADRPLNVSETKKISMAGEVDKGFGSVKGGVPPSGAPAHWVELVRRQAPELLFHEDSVLDHPTDFFATEDGEAKPTTESADDPSARMDTDKHQEHPSRFAKQQWDRETPSAPIYRASFPTDDSSNFTAGSEDRAGVSSGLKAREQDFRKVTSFVVSEKPLSESADVPSKRTANPGEPELPFGDRQHRAHIMGPAAESVQVHEKIPAKVFSSNTSIGPVSELKRHIVANSRSRKKNATENPAAAVSFRGGVPEPVNVPPSKAQTDKTEDIGRPDGVSSNHALNEPFLGNSISDGRNSNFKTEGQNPFISAREKVSREEDFQPFNHTRAQDLAWPNLPGDPDRKNPMATFQDRWPALLEEDPDLGNQPLNERWQYYSGKIKVAERIRRLDREQRGLGWNE